MRLDAESKKLEKELMELNGRREQYEVAIKDFQDKAFAAQEKIVSCTSSSD